MNKIKIILIVTFTFFYFICLKATVSATTNSYIEITHLEADAKNQAIKFNVETDISKNVIEYGVLLSKYNEDLVLENLNVYKYKYSNPISKRFSISLKIPEYALYQNIYACSYVIMEDNVFYSNKVYSSYAKLANLDKVVLNDIIFSSNSLIFKMNSSIDLNAEYGLIFTKSKVISDLTIENAKNAHFEAEIIKLDELNESNEYYVTIKDIPIYELDVDFRARAYVKNKDTLETYYSNTIKINLLQEYFKDIINNVEISYNDEQDGIKFKSCSCIFNNNQYKLGFVFINKEVENLNVSLDNALVVESVSDKFSVTMKNIPLSKIDEKIYMVSYLKFINEEGIEEYYYSDIYITSYNKVKKQN